MNRLLRALHLRRPGPFEPPTLLDHLLASPLQSLLTLIYHLLLRLRGRPFAPHRTAPLRVVCLSDTHDRIVPAVPAGDLLVHAGDLTTAGTAADIQAQVDWLDGLPHEHKVLVCGNHDGWFDARSRAPADREGGRGRGRGVDFKSVRYLERESAVLEFRCGRRLNVYGAPDIPQCGGDEFAFQYPRSSPPWKDTIPVNTDILITHTPPAHHLDLSLGCPSLLAEVWRVRPRLHIFGHVHWGRGREPVHFDDCQRAYERLMARPPRRWPVLDLLVPSGAWLDALRVVLHGANAVLFKVLMQGPGANSASLMVNAAQMVGNTGRVGGRVEVVDI